MKQTLDTFLSKVSEDLERRRREITEELAELRDKKGQYLEQIRHLREKVDQADKTIAELQAELGELENGRPAKEAEAVKAYVASLSEDRVWSSPVSAQADRLRKKLEHLEALVAHAESEQEREIYRRMLEETKAKLESLESRGKAKKISVQIPFSFYEDTLRFLLPLEVKRAELAGSAEETPPGDLGQAFLYSLVSLCHRFATKELDIGPSDVDYEDLDGLLLLSYELRGAEPDDVKSFVQVVWEDVVSEVSPLASVSVRFYWVSERVWRALEGVQ